MQVENQDASRSLAIRMARVGMPTFQIAFMLGIEDDGELLALYGTEMRRAAIEANLQIWEKLWLMANSGTNTTATIFWLKTRADATPATTRKPVPTTKPSFKDLYGDQVPPASILRVVGPDGTLYD